MADLRAFCCWLPDQADLGHAYTLTSSADQARVCVARSVADVGFLPRASPHLVRCRRVPEHDRNPALKEGVVLQRGSRSTGRCCCRGGGRSR